jgi:hypothetical protein
MCIDEFYLGKKSKQKYAFVMLDFSNSQITDILPTRKKDYLLKYFSSIPKAERQNVKYICMDMYDTYKIVAKYRFPNAKIAVDSFHVIKHINEALIALRIKIMNKFDKNTNSLEANDLYYYMLKRFHYFFVKDYDKIYNGFIKIPKMKTKLKKDQILDYLLSIDETLKKAYYLKEEYRDLLDSHEDVVELHRNQLEHLLVHSLYGNIIKIYKFAAGEERKFIDIIISRFEIDMLKKCIANLDNNHMNLHVKTYGNFFNKHSNIEFNGIHKAKDIHEAAARRLDAVAETPYG